MDNAPEVVGVDWREEEGNIVEAISLAIAPDSITCEWLGVEDLILHYKGNDRPMGLTFSPKDRYVCLRAISDILSGDYELRLFETSYLSDTHSFLMKPVSWWAEFDLRYPKQSSFIFRKIDAALDLP